MDELLGDDRAPRTFRAKFPEEVLQESLAGQLWFGAECLAAGSSIMNRETESAQMRPLAKAVTKSLDHVRNLLREQCLRNKTPNSLTLNLDLNDAVTETLCESLKIFDRLFAEFELLYVSAMVQVKSKQEHEMQELICVLFSETLQRALRIGLLEQEQVDYYDPALMFSIPRLAIVAGLVIYNKGPLNMSMPPDQLSEMFRPFRTLLIKIRDLLRTLNANELYQLEKLLCTNEDIHIYREKDTKSIEKCPEVPDSNPQTSSLPPPLTPSEPLPTQSVIVPPSPPPAMMMATTTTTTPTPATANHFNCDDDSDDEEKFIGSNSSASSTSSESSTSTVSRTSSNTSQSISASSNSTLEIPSGSESEFERRYCSNRPQSIGANIMDGNELIPNHHDHHHRHQQQLQLQQQQHVNVWSTEPFPGGEASSTSILVDSSIEPDSPTQRNKNEWMIQECASGYLIPNTNFGNLLQTTDAPLTDSFISSDDEYTQKNLPGGNGECDTSSYGEAAVNGVGNNSGGGGSGGGTTSMDTMDSESDIAAIQSMMDNVRMCNASNEPNQMNNMNSITGIDNDANHQANVKCATNFSDSGNGTAESTSLNHSPESEIGNIIDLPSPTTNGDVNIANNVQMRAHQRIDRPFRGGDGGGGYVYAHSPTEMYNPHTLYQNYTHPSYYQNNARSPDTQQSQYDDDDDDVSVSLPASSRLHARLHQSQQKPNSHTQYSRRERYERKSSAKTNGNHSISSKGSSSNGLRRRSSRHRSRNTEEKVSISSTSCIYSEGDPQDVWHNSGRLKFK